MPRRPSAKKPLSPPPLPPPAVAGTAVVSRRAAERLRSGHPWVYRSDIETLGSQNPGLIAVLDNRGHLLGTALLSPESQIALRLIAPGEMISEEEWAALLDQRLQQAIALRHSMVDEQNDACRLVFSEADQLPGLIVDRYGELILVEILTKALDSTRIRSLVADRLRSDLDPAVIVERVDPRIRELEHLSPSSGEPLYSKNALPQLTTIFHLNGLAFHYDAGAGQKTGAFLDQRLNYAAAARFAHGEALDVCTYQGGFALHLARACSRVTGVDASRAALEVAEENLAVNRHRLAAPVEWMEANAFDLLRDWSDSGALYDTIVLDPPAFAKSKRAVESALRGYKELNLRALKMLRPGGVLITCSCSHQVSSGDFEATVAAAAGDARRRLRLLERRGAAPDHPVVLNVPETEYLKCLILAVD
jgi:23S rRNA (cytosine1962-C5)-methyltransferase